MTMIELAERCEQRADNALKTAFNERLSVFEIAAARRSAFEWLSIAASLRSRAAQPFGEEW